jgi:hypothetical protein
MVPQVSLLRPGILHANAGGKICHLLPLKGTGFSRMYLVFLLRCIGHDGVWGGGLSRKNGMYDAIVRRGPEGRWLNVSPARKGWGMGRMILSAVGAALYRAATQTSFRRAHNLVQ